MHHLAPTEKRLAKCNTRLHIIETILRTNPPAQRKIEMRRLRMLEIDRRQEIKAEMIHNRPITVVK